MKFLKAWMLNLLALIIIIIILPVVCGYIVYLLAIHLGTWILYVILLMLVSLAITINS